MPKTVIMRGGEYKYRAVKMQLKLRDQQLKIITYIYRLLYKNLTVTANQKCIIDTQMKKRKESKHNTKDSHQITREENKEEEKNKKELQKQPQTINKWQ